MKALLRVSLLLLGLLLLPAGTHASGEDLLGFRFGYLNSTLIYRPGNIEARVNDFNTKPSTKTQMELPPRLQGVHIGFDRYKVINDNISVVYHADLYLRHLKTNTATYTDDGEQDVRLKMKVNSLNWVGVGVRSKFF